MSCSDILNLKMKLLLSFETSLSVYQSTRRNIPADLYSEYDLCQNRTSRNINLLTFYMRARVCACVCICVFMYVLRMYVYMYVCMCMCLCVFVCMDVCICMCMCLYVCMYMCMCVCITYVCVCMYV